MLLSPRTLFVLAASIAFSLTVPSSVRAANLIFTDNGSDENYFFFEFGSNGIGALSIRGVLTEPGN